MDVQTDILLAGIGNIFQGDDAFGCEVAQQLLALKWPPGVRVVDFGIRGWDLAYALLDAPRLTLLIDAASRGGPPGTLYVIEPTLEDGVSNNSSSLLDGHSLNPMQVLRMVRALGGRCGKILVVGCEPAELGGAEGVMGLSEPIRNALPEAVKMVQSLVAAAGTVDPTAGDFWSLTAGHRLRDA